MLLSGSLFVTLIVIVTLYPGYKRNYYMNAVESALAKRDYPELVTNLEVALALNLRPDYYTYLLGTSYYALKEYDKAIPALQRHLQYGASPGVEQLIASCLYEKGERDAGMEAFRKILAKDPKAPIANYYMGLENMRQGKLQEASWNLFNTADNKEWNEKAAPLRAQIYAEFIKQTSEMAESEAAHKPGATDDLSISASGSRSNMMIPNASTITTGSHITDTPGTGTR